MKVVNVSERDHANFSYYNAEAMRSAGIDAAAYCLFNHNYNYPKQAKRVKFEQIFNICKDADVIQIMHSCKKMTGLLTRFKGKKIVVWHTGTAYRQNAGEFNQMFKKASKVVYALAEFKYLCPKGAEYFGITVPEFKPDYSTDVLRFAHYPSNPLVKGSKDVIGVFNEIGVGLNTGPVITYQSNQERISKCDVYVEMMASRQSGKPYGSFGTTAVEAAMMGKIVMTNNTNPEVYKEAYGNYPMLISNTQDELKENIRKLLVMDKDQIVDLKKKHHKWAIESHSFKASGHRMKKLLCID